MRINPIGPVRPIDFDRLLTLFDSLSFVELICCVTFTIFIQLITVQILKKTPMNMATDNKIPIYHAIVAAFVSMMLFFFGWSTALVKGVAFLLILLYATVCDIEIREVSDCVSIMIIIASLIDTEVPNIIISLIGGAVVGGIMLLSAILTKNRLGGADVKMSAACTVFLGLWDGIYGLMIGLLLSVIVNLLLRHSDKSKSYPLVPYLAAGFMAAYIM